MSCFSELFDSEKQFIKLKKAITPGGAPVGALGVTEAFRPQLISAFSQEKRTFVITPDEASAVKLSRNLSAVQGGVLYYPSREFTLRNVRGVSHDFEQLRLGVLSKILSDDFMCVVSSAASAREKTISPGSLRAKTRILRIGDRVDLDELRAFLTSAGYSKYDQVDGRSQFAVRGGIVDIFSPETNNPARLELWGDKIDAIYAFDTDTQRRINKLSEVQIVPCREVLFDNTNVIVKKIESLAASLSGKAIKAREGLERDAEMLRGGLSLESYDKYLSLVYSDSRGLFDYAGEDDIVFVCDSAGVKEHVKRDEEAFDLQIKKCLEDGTLCKGLDDFFVGFDELTQIYGETGAVYLDSLPRGSFDTPVKELVNFNAQSLSPWNGTFESIKSELKPLVKDGYTVCIMAGTARSAKSLTFDLQDAGLKALYAEHYPQSFQKGIITVLPGSLDLGWRYPELKFALITHLRTFQKKKKKRLAKAKDAIHSLDELSKGDYIVHNVHGIGIYDGVEALEIDNIKKDYIKISYAGGDLLYVPVTQLDLVSKYVAPGEGERVKINRLGSSEWKRTKEKVKASVQDMAKELISVYSKRMATKGYAFSPDSDFQRDFELRFPYEETEDQLRCADEIKRDMESPVPMERLLCGDVGFGKTEVALRAAFKCILDGKQCAILVPTTVLAMQHFATARQRMENFPVKVEMLSRFVSPSGQKRIKKELAEGKIDLLVGTHKIIGKNIVFKDLGLLIIDEEQRFGVAQKERLKAKYPYVDELTLSATPIPRTLNMALSGIRDMSVIEEAPGDRHPVQTYVMEYNFPVLKEAMERELSRGGQVYFLHNSIDSIQHTAYMIKQAIPNASVGIAHGRMNEEQLSGVWSDLIRGDIDILVCTTIIETGVDVPNVNTLIIEDSDHMGLAQLHQIRGRVGRSSRRAYAYLTFTKGKQITETAAKRLEAIREYTDFGSGFKIAMRDLEIRGAGSLLGSRQHGHMAQVGYDMYLKLLNEAVEEQKGGEAAQKKECLVDLPLEAHIPDDYIQGPQRLAIYKRIAAISNAADAEDVNDELCDRFGTPPPSVSGLIEIALIRNRATALDIYEISRHGNLIRFYTDAPDVEKVMKLSRAVKGKVKIEDGKKPYFSVSIGQNNPVELTNTVLNFFENNNQKDKTV